KVGDTMTFQIIRKGTILNVPVPLIAGKRIPAMSYSDYPALGPVRNDSWMERTLTEKGLRPWADTIAKQIAAIADLDFCDAPFSERPNPLRLNAVTYLDHHPTRVGALSRLIDEMVWDRLEAGPGLAGAIDAAAEQLGCLTKDLPRPKLPQTEEELNKYFADVQTLLDRAYANVHSDVGTLSWQLSELLNTDTNWEDPVDSIPDPVHQLSARDAAERMLVRVLGAADRVDFQALTGAAHRLAALADTGWVPTFAAQFLDLMDEQPTIKNVPGVDGEVIATWDTPEGRCVIGGPGPNRYYGDFAFILDVGGN